MVCLLKNSMEERRKKKKTELLNLSSFAVHDLKLGFCGFGMSWVRLILRMRGRVAYIWASD